MTLRYIGATAGELAGHLHEGLSLPLSQLSQGLFVAGIKTQDISQCLLSGNSRPFLLPSLVALILPEGDDDPYWPTVVLQHNRFIRGLYLFDRQCVS